MKKSRRMADSRAARLLVAVFLVAALAGLGAAVQMFGTGAPALPADSPSVAAPQLGETYGVTIDAAEVRLACPPGTVDPLELGALADESSTWVFGDVEEQDLQGLGSLILPAPTPNTETAMSGDGTGAAGPEGFPAGISVAGVASGDAAGLLVASCQVPANQLALVGGSTMVGEDTFVTLVNPNPRPVDVNIMGYGAGGALEDLSQPLTLPPETSVVWMPAPWFPDEDRLALVVDASGGGVAAWLQSSGRDGEVPMGLSRLAGASLDRVNVFPGVSEEEGPWSMRVLNPTDQVLTVTVSTADEDGAQDLAGATDLQVDPGAVFEVGLEGIGTDPVTVVARADQPFSAGLASQSVGAAHPLVKDQKVQSRTLLGPVVGTAEVTLPPASEVARLATDRDFKDVEMSLTLANLDSAAVTVGGGETEYELAPGTSRTLTAEETAELPGHLQTDGKVYAALTVAAETKLGPVRAIFGLGFGGFAAVERTVVLTP